MGINIIEYLVVFFLALNLFSGMLITSGIADDIGIGSAAEVGGDDRADQATQEARNVSTGAPTGQTLFGMYNVLAETLGQIRVIVLGGPQMLGNAGVPGFITRPMEGLMLMAYAVGLIRFLRGV
jgi:hypothetical protein